MPIDSKECFAALTEDGQLWEIYQAAQTGGGGITSINGDTTAAQTIAGTAPIGVASVGGTTTISSTQAGTATNGYLSSTDWNTFNNKVNRSGDTMTGKLTLPASTTASAPINFPHGSDPTSPTNGDIWLNGTLRYRDQTGTTRFVADTNRPNTFSQRQTISADSFTTLPALRITQEGTGEALRVEDDTTPDSTAFVVSNSGRVGIGVTPDATVALSVDTTGIKFGDNTVQTTAAVSGVTSVTATAPLTSSGGTTPDISTSISTNRIVGRSTAGTGVMEQLTPVGITVSAGNITGIGGTVGTVDNAVPRADGTGGFTVQGSDIVIDDAVPFLSGVTGLDSTDYITVVGNTFVANQQIFFGSLTGGSALTVNTPYFVRDVGGAGANTFRISTTSGGAVQTLGSDISAGTVGAGQTNVAIANQHSGQTNSSLVLTPKGTGAFIVGPKPDGTATGGNARGTNAVDLQTSRTTAAQVASGARAFIGGGQNNTVSAGGGVICGGTGNTCSTAGGNSENFVGGGNGNSASGANNAVCVGGTSNTASGERSFVGGGNSNSATAWSAAVCGGRAASAQGTGSFVGGGYVSLASGNGAVVGGGGLLVGGSSAGGGNTASGTSTGILGGQRALADRYAMQAHGAGEFSAQGDAQRARFVLRCKTTTNAAVEMALDGSTTYLTIPSGKVMFMNIRVVGTKSDGSAVATYERQYAVKNVAGTSSEIYAAVIIGTDNAAGTSLAVATVDAGDYVSIKPTGITSETWRWVASVDAVEVAYGT